MPSVAPLHRQIDPAVLRRIYVRRRQPTRMERFMLFMALNGEVISFWFALFAIALLVGVIGGAFLAGAR